MVERESKLLIIGREKLGMYNHDISDARALNREDGLLVNGTAAGANDVTYRMVHAAATLVCRRTHR